MACPEESFPTWIRFDSLRAARKGKGGTSCCEGHGERNEGRKRGGTTETDTSSEGKASCEGRERKIRAVGGEDAQEEAGTAEAQGKAQQVAQLMISIKRETVYQLDVAHDVFYPRLGHRTTLRMSQRVRSACLQKQEPFWPDWPAELSYEDVNSAE